MERKINTLMWHLETNNLIAKKQAGFRQNRLTVDQAGKIRHFGSVDRYGKGIR